MRKLCATLFLMAALAVGAVAPSASAFPSNTGGLADITITYESFKFEHVIGLDFAEAIAAKVCDVPVSEVVAGLNDGDNTYTCTNLDLGVTVTITKLV